MLIDRHAVHQARAIVSANVLFGVYRRWWTAS